MSLELITSLTNVATLVVLVIGAVVAIAQLRHLGAANQLAAILALEAGFADPELQRALLYVQNVLPNALARPHYRLELWTRGYIDPYAHPEMAVCNWFNEAGTKIGGKYLNEDLFFQSFGRLVEHYWRLLGPVVALLRRERGSEQYASFAYLAYRAARWREAHADGRYPPGAPRLPAVDRWRDADRRSGDESA